MDFFVGEGWVWYVFCGLLLTVLIFNLVLRHKKRIRQWERHKVDLAFRHSGIVEYQKKLKQQKANNEGLSSSLLDVSGIVVEMGLHNGGRGVEEKDVQVGSFCLEELPENVSSIIKSPSPRQDSSVPGVEEYRVGRPTQNELEMAVAHAILLRETGLDEKHLGKCLLNLHYRNKLLERVLEHSSRYLHSGSDPNEHKLLLKAIDDVQSAGQIINHDADGCDGTFMMS